jgi:glutamate synthase domain-containing protein 2
MRHLFYTISVAVLLVIAVIAFFYPSVLYALVVVVPLIAIGLYNTAQKKHTILRNFPVVGYFRYFFEMISPEIQQYFIERATDGRPFSRNHRGLVYKRAKNVNETHPFGTQHDIDTLMYHGLRHSIYALPPQEDAPRVIIGNDQCKQPYVASLLNISAMSFGSISKNAILAMGKGAHMGNFYLNTGEGGLSEHHLKSGGDLVWQIGTAYFGCRGEDGAFDPEQFREKAAHEQVRMIELKLSQGAKPGHGGVLPAIKNNEEIARNRGIQPHVAVISPPGHVEFSDAKGLLQFLQKLRELSGGKPVGFKLCIGRTEEFVEICGQMHDTGIIPDFVTIDGAEGGTGAAPLEFADSVGMPLETALIFVHNTLKQHQLRDKIKVIASGKIITAASMLKVLVIGADICNSARAFMFATGCIQALRCNTNQCPTGVTTQDPLLVKGLVVEDKKDRVFHFQKNTLRAVMELLAACGKTKFTQLNKEIFIRGAEMARMQDRFFDLHTGEQPV